MYVCTHVCSRQSVDTYSILLSHLWRTATPRLQVVLHKATAMDAKAITSIELSASRAQCVTCVAWWLDTQFKWVCQNSGDQKKMSDHPFPSLKPIIGRTFVFGIFTNVLRVWPMSYLGAFRSSKELNPWGGFTWKASNRDATAEAWPELVPAKTHLKSFFFLGGDYV